MSDVFDDRIRRAAHLEQEWPFASDLLRFCGKVWSLQREPLPAELFVARLVNLILQAGPPDLARQAGALPDLDAALKRYADGEVSENPVPEFVYRRLEEREWIEKNRRVGESTFEGKSSGKCPACLEWPIVSVLREDKNAETVRRSLICRRCSREWDFPRVLCPSCDEEKTEKLPRYTAQEIPWIRVDACDTCKKYIKSVDLTLNWDAEPIVDELASTPLDVIAREHGYTKITPNLAGI